MTPSFDLRIIPRMKISRVSYGDQVLVITFGCFLASNNEFSLSRVTYLCPGDSIKLSKAWLSKLAIFSEIEYFISSNNAL